MNNTKTFINTNITRTSDHIYHKLRNIMTKYNSSYSQLEMKSNFYIGGFCTYSRVVSYSGKATL